MNILVLGNGFDLAHGLPTAYNDFLDFVQEFSKTGATNEKAFNGYIYMLNNENFNRLMEIKNLIDKNCWLSYFLDQRKVLKANQKEGWIDFEGEISKIIQHLDLVRHRLKEHNKTNPQAMITSSTERMVLFPIVKYIDCKFDDYWDKDNLIAIKTSLLSNLEKLIRCLEIYLSDYISYYEENHNIELLLDIVKLNPDMVLSFNYTDTYKKLYKKTDNRIDFDYIHGKASVNNNIYNCNLVLGIDEYLSGDSINYDNAYIEFKKFYQRIY